MPVSAEGRVEHQKRTQTATTLWPFGFVFCVQLGSLEKKKTRREPVLATLVHIVASWMLMGCNDDDEIGTKWLPSFGKGQIENHKRTRFIP